MTGNQAPGRYLRQSDHATDVLPIELFFDLVYVLAVTQITEFLLQHLSWRGGAQTLILLLAVWLVWMHVAWLTNYFELRRRSIRMMLIVLMFTSLIGSAAIPSAFDGRNLAFAGGLIATAVVSSVWVWILVGPGHPLRSVFLRLAIWWSALPVLGVTGAILGGDPQIVLWLLALAICYVVMWLGFPVPGLGHSHSTDYTISGGHMAQRCSLFVTIALGESILITGTDFGDLPSSFAGVVAFVTAFVSTVAIWWIYFDRHAEAAAEVIAQAEDPGRLGLIAYTYAHILIVGGIIVAAAGNEIALAHPRDEASTAEALLIIGGPALFLAGSSVFKVAIWNHISVSRAGGLVALGALSLLAMMASSLVLLAAVSAVLIAVVAYDLLNESRYLAEAASQIQSSSSPSIPTQRTHE
jgi:low temperature requirement protein LtrA